MARRKRRTPPRNAKGQFVSRRRRNPPRRRARRNPPRRRRRVTRARSSMRAAPRRRRRYRRNPPTNPWLAVLLGAGLVTAAEGLIRAKVSQPQIREWGPLALKALGAFVLRKKYKPAAYALAGLAVADLAALVLTRIMPAAAAPTPTAGLIALPPGLAGPMGFPTGVGYPAAPGRHPRLEVNPAAQGYGYALGQAVPMRQAGAMSVM